MLRWYAITSPSPEGLRSVLKSLRSQHLMVRKRNSHLIACVSNHHQTWLTRVCQDFNANLKVLEEIPEGVRVPKKEEYLAPCGAEFYDPMLFAQHCRNCSACNATKAVPTIAKLEPGQELSLDGVIVSLEVARDQLMEKWETVDNLITNLKAYRDAKDKLSELYTETDKRMMAVRLLINDGKLPR